jgi:HNH endonuclease
LAISKRLRFEILRRDGFRCRYCRNGETLLTVDHVTPRVLGGTDAPSNLVACCDDCNTGKASTLPGGATIDGPDDDLVRWTRAVKRAAYLAREKRDEVDRYREEFRKEWSRWHYGQERAEFPLAAEWGYFIDQFHAASLPSWMWRELVEHAMAGNVHGDRFKYVCALAWKRTAALQQAARIDASGERGVGDWAERETHAVVTAAAYVWQSAFCAAQGKDPEPEAAATFRARARALFPEEMDAADLMRAADASGGRDIEDLQEAFDYVRDETEDAWDQDRCLATWTERWRETTTDAGSPDEATQDEFRDHFGAAVWAGYDGIVIGEAAFRAAESHTPQVANFLKSAHDVLRDWRERRERTAALAREATVLWLDAFSNASNGDRPVAAEIDKFTEHVANTIGWNCDEYVLQAARQAGAEFNYTINRHLPAETEVPF